MQRWQSLNHYKMGSAIGCMQDYIFFVHIDHLLSFSYAKYTFSQMYFPLIILNTKIGEWVQMIQDGYLMWYNLKDFGSSFIRLRGRTVQVSIKFWKFHIIFFLQSPLPLSVKFLGDTSHVKSNIDDSFLFHPLYSQLQPSSRDLYSEFYFLRCSCSCNSSYACLIWSIPKCPNFEPYNNICLIVYV